MVASNSFPATCNTSEPAANPAASAILARQDAFFDATLVRRFNAGDDKAFVEIVTRHRAKMYTIAFSVLRNHSDAEEIAQDTFIRAHRGLTNFRGDSSLATRSEERRVGKELGSRGW